MTSGTRAFKALTRVGGASGSGDCHYGDVRYLSSQFTTQLVAVAVVLAVAAAAAVVVARRGPSTTSVRRLSLILLGAAVALVLSGTALPSTAQLLPGEGDLALAVGRGGLGRAVEAVRAGGSELVLLLGNIALYALLGGAALLALRVRGWSATAAVGVAVLVSAALSVLVEAWQYAALGRVAATDDVLLNTLGALLGATLTLALVAAHARLRGRR